MKHTTLPLICLVVLLGVSTQQAAFAITPSNELAIPPKIEESKPTGSDKTIKRIRTEDAGSRIDELRVGGETQKISVQPKIDVPAYEVQPVDSSTAPANTGSGGKRVWNVLPF